MTDSVSGNKVYIGLNCIQVGSFWSYFRLASADRVQCGTKRKLGIVGVLYISQSFDTP